MSENLGRVVARLTQFGSVEECSVGCLFLSVLEGARRGQELVSAADLIGHALEGTEATLQQNPMREPCVQGQVD